MNNNKKGIKIQVSRLFETILGVGLWGLYPWKPLGVLTVCSQTPSCRSQITHYVHEPGKVTTFLLQPKFKSCIKPC